MRPDSIVHWSGGKDSALALHQVLRDRSHTVKYLLTSVNPEHQRVSMHGVRVDVLRCQANAIGLPLHILEVPVMPTMAAYNAAMHTTLKRFAGENIRHSIYGDIFLQDLRDYRIGQLAKVPMEGVFPIWQRPTDELVREFIASGFRAVTVCVNDRYLDDSFVGREIDAEFVADLPEGVDPCGENGEFHSFVYDGPIFREPVPVKRGEKVYRRYEAPPKSDNDDSYGDHDQPVFDSGFWYCDLQLKA